MGAMQSEVHDKQVAIRRLAEEFRQRFAEPKTDQYWMQRADRHVAYLRRLVEEHPSVLWTRVLEAGLEWQRLIKAKHFSRQAAMPLLEEVERNKWDGHQWRDLAEDIANWSYSNGMQEGIPLSHLWWVFTKATADGP